MSAERTTDLLKEERDAWKRLALAMWEYNASFGNRHFGSEHWTAWRAAEAELDAARLALQQLGLLDAACQPVDRDGGSRDATIGAVTDDEICVACGNPRRQSGCTSTSCWVRHVPIAPPGHPTLVVRLGCLGRTYSYLAVGDESDHKHEAPWGLREHARVFRSAAAAGAWIDARPASERWATEPA